MDKELNSLVQRHQDANFELREAQMKVHEADYRVKQYLVNNELEDCLNVNWSRVRKLLR